VQLKTASVAEFIKVDHRDNVLRVSVEGVNFWVLGLGDAKSLLSVIRSDSFIFHV